MKSLLESIVKDMVDSPNGVVIEEVKTANGTAVLNIKTAPADAGKIIGKQGRNIKALRIIMAAIAMRRGCYAILEVQTSNGRDHDAGCTCASHSKRERSRPRV